ncbi:MAG: hypothetical protein WBA43_21400 [Elainellaceae cyanobacterium]
MTAASSGGPRYDASLSSQQRKSPENGIWLCQNCAKLVDNDPSSYTLERLNHWKRTAEREAIHEIEGRTLSSIPSDTLASKRLDAYEKLFYALKEISKVVNYLFETEELSKEEKKAVAFGAGLEVAELTDSESFFLDEKIIIHSVGAFVGLDEIFDIDDLIYREAEIDQFRRNIRNAYKMIQSVRDFGELDHSIRSPIIDHFNTLKQTQDLEDQAY